MKHWFNRIFSLLLALVLVLPLLQPFSVRAEDFDTENFQGLVIQADSAVKINLYSGYTYSSKLTVITPDHTETEGENTLYYYAGLQQGKYVCRATQSGYYTIYQQIYMSAAEVATKTVETVVMEEMAGNGWEDTSVYIRSSEAAAAFSDTSEAWWGNYVDGLTSPAFTIDRAANQMTTQSEMEAFLTGLDDANDNMYIFSLGASSTYKLDIPVAIFTTADLSGVSTLEDAAQKLKAEGKPIVEYRAQMHGNEPAAGEAALNVIADLDGEYGREILESISVYIIPRLNTDGGYKNTRTVATGEDPNRDMLSLNVWEMQLHQDIFLMMEPMLIIDAHERQYTGTNADMMLSIGSTLHNSDTFFDTSVAIANAAFDALQKQDMSGWWYQNAVNSADPNISRAYSANTGTIFILLESIGIQLGLGAYEERTVCQIISAEAVLSYVASHAEETAAVVAAEKASFVTTGATYEESDTVVLSTGKTANADYAMTVDHFNLGNGAVTQQTMTPYVYDTVKRSRVAPTAYVLPADLENIQQILALMDKQNISYRYLPENCTLALQQYYGTMEEAFLTTERNISFAGGAYVFCMNQTTRNILSALMEPDCTDANGDEYNGNLVKQALVGTDGNGYFPIYRYITDLNDGGTVDYVIAPSAPEGLTVLSGGVISGLDSAEAYEYRAATAETYTPVQAGATQITGLNAGTYYVRYAATENAIASTETQCQVGASFTVYVSAASGADSNDGFSSSTPVATLDTAYSLLFDAIGGADLVSDGTVVLLDDYTIASDSAVSLPTHTYPVTIKGASETVKLIYAPTGSTQPSRSLYMGGPTTLDDINIVYSYAKGFGYLCANGNKLTIGDGVTTTANSKGYYLNLVGGHYSTGVVDTDLTVNAGTWRNVYIDGYTGTHSGKVSLVMENCSVTHLIQNAYSGSSTGDNCIDLKNVSVGAIYCGNANSGNVAGNVTLTLRSGVTVSSGIYTGCRDDGNMTGTVTVVADGCDLSAFSLNNSGGTIAEAVLVYASGRAIPVDGFDEVVIDTSAGGTVTLTENLTVDKIIGGGILELNGCSLTCNTAAQGSVLQVSDCQTDDYDVDDGVYGRLVGFTDNVKAAGGYVKITDENGISFHKVDMALNSVSLRAGRAALYYTGTYLYDTAVAEHIESCGTVLSIKTELPTVDDGVSAYTTSSNSTLLADIMRTENEPAENTKNAETPVCGRAYIRLQDGTCLYSKVYTVTLRQMLETIDAQKWDSLTPTQLDSLVQMYQSYRNVMAEWDIKNLKAYVSN